MIIIILVPGIVHHAARQFEVCSEIAVYHYKANVNGLKYKFIPIQEGYKLHVSYICMYVNLLHISILNVNCCGIFNINMISKNFGKHSIV